MLKLKRPLFILTILLIFVILLVLGLTTYLVISGVRVKYLTDQKKFLIDISKNELLRKTLVDRDLFLNDNKSFVLITHNPANDLDIDVKVSQTTPTQKGGSGEVAKEIVEKFKDDPAGLYFFKIGWGVKKVGAFDMWDYTKTAFVAEVVSYKNDTKELTLKIKSPAAMPYSGETITVVEKCDPNKSYLESGGMNTNPVMNLEENISPGAVLFTGQCFDEKCSEVGPFCKVSIL